MSARTAIFPQRLIKVSLGNLMPKAFLLLKRLLAESDEYKASWNVNIFGDDNVNDDGLIRKFKSDKKWYLHYSPQLKEHLLAAGVDISNHLELFDICDIIFAEAARAALELCRHYDETVPGHDFVNKMKVYGSKLRLLLYDEDETLLAHPHVDRAGVTVHLWESHPALHVFSPDGIQPYTQEDGWALGFPGGQVDMLTDGLVPALGHFALTNIGTQRSTAVFFAQMEHPFALNEMKHFVKTKTRHYTELLQRQTA